MSAHVVDCGTFKRLIRLIYYRKYYESSNRRGGYLTRKYGGT